MGKVRTIHVCGGCGQQLAQWSGRCPGCGAWGTIGERAPVAAVGHAIGAAPVDDLRHREAGERRVSTAWTGVDRVLGGGIVPATFALLAGEPGIGKSTLLLQLVANLSAAGTPCLLASGEESRDQVSARARRLGIEGSALAFVPGRELPVVLEAAREARPFLLAVDSIQSLRDPDGGQVPGGPSQVRSCADALAGFAKAEGVAVVVTGHVTKDGDLAGPKTLEHAVDVVLPFEGDPRSGLRRLSCGKNRFGAEGEVAWFEMTASGLLEIDPTSLLLPGSGEPGTAVALPLTGRRALAVEVQALVVPTEGPPRRQVSGLDPRRFQLIAAVLEAAGVPLGRSDLYGATAGGARLDDPACDLAVAAALTSAVSGVPVPPGSAFVGEVGLTGVVRPSPSFGSRGSAARAVGIRTVFAAPAGEPPEVVRLVGVGNVMEALTWAGVGAARVRGR